VSEIDITAVSKLKHSELYEAAKSMGGQSALARHLGIHPSELGMWCNLKACPPVEMDDKQPHQTQKKWGGGRLGEIERKLFDLTGKTLVELFPKELREAKEFLNSPKTIEQRKTMQTDALLRYAESTKHRLAYAGQESIAINSELSEHITDALKELPERLRTIITLRYGLDGNGRRTLDEAGKAVGVSKERLRQLEAKAIRDLQHPRVASGLVDFIDSEKTYSTHDQTRERWPSEKYAETS